MSDRKPKIQLVIFDWAGTVIDFGSCAPVEAFVQVFAARNVPISRPEARGPMGTHKRDHLVHLLENPAIAARWRGVMGRPWTEADVDAMYGDLMPLQLASVEQHAEIVPGLLECVSELRRQNIKIGGTTGYFRAAAELCLAAGKRQGYVPDANVCGDDVPKGRPAPWMVYRVMEATGVYPPKSVLKIGDTLVDIAEGHNAGCWSAAVTASSSELGLTATEFATIGQEEKRRRLGEVRGRFEAAGADAVIESLQEVPRLVAELNERMG